MHHNYIVYKPNNSGTNPSRNWRNRLQKTLANRIRSGIRHARQIRHQHEIIPWTHIFWLSFKTDIDEKRFLRRFRRYNKGRFHISGTIERARGAARNHYSGVVRTDGSKQEFEHLISTAIARRGHNYSEERSQFDLRYEVFNRERIAQAAKYQSKSTENLLSKNELMEKGKREFFTIGRPWTKPTRELQKLTSREIVRSVTRSLAHQPEILYALMQNGIDHEKIFTAKMVHWLVS